MDKIIIPVGISGKHVHLCQKTLDILFGCKNYQLTFFKNLKQKGQFAAEEKIDVMSPTGKIIKDLRILGPVRNIDQIEISRSDSIRAGFDTTSSFNTPVRSSGNIKGTPGATLIGPKGQVEISEGVIIANIHIHLSLEEAANFHVVDKQIVNIKLNGLKSGILGQVVCRVDQSFTAECHLDADYGSAFLLQNGDTVELITKILV